MKTLSSDAVDKIENVAFEKGTWEILRYSYGKLQLAQRVSFYEYAGCYYSVIHRPEYRAKSFAYLYYNRDEALAHFRSMKSKSESIGYVFRKDESSH